MNKEDLKYGNVVELEEINEKNNQRFLVCKYDGKPSFLSLEENHYGAILYYLFDYFSFNKNEKDCKHIVRVYEDYTCSKLLWKDENQPELTDKDKEFLKYLPEKVKAEVNAFIKFIDWYLKVNFLDNPQISYTELGVAYKIYKDIVYKAECSFGKIMKKENN